MKKIIVTVLIVFAWMHSVLAQDTIHGCFPSSPLPFPFFDLPVPCPDPSFSGPYNYIVYNGDTLIESGFGLGFSPATFEGTQGSMDFYCQRPVGGAPDSTVHFIGNFVPQICIVTIDENDHPVINIDSSSLYGNTSVILQRKATTSSWSNIATFAAGSVLSITDSTANTRSQSYVYRLYTSSCLWGTEHRTIHLEANGQNLIWNEYEPNYPALRGYYINKRDGNGNFVVIDSTTGLTYTDLSFQTGDEYFVEAFKDDICPYANQLRQSGPPSVRSNKLQIGCTSSITDQPDHATATIGNTVTFAVSSFSSSATYQWQTNSGSGWQTLNNGGQYSGVSANVLTVSNVTLANNAQAFRCIVTADVCTETSSAALLSVQCVSMFTTHPESKTAVAGGDVTFEIEVSAPAPAYQWQTDLGTGWQNLSNAGQYSGATAASLSVAALTASNDNQHFRCVVSASNCSDTSVAAILSVLPTSIEGNIFLNGMSLYPNPMHDQLVLEYSLDKQQLLTIGLYDVRGRLLKQFMQDEMRREGAHREILYPDQTLPAGNYFLRIANGSGIVAIRIVKD